MHRCICSIFLISLATSFGEEVDNLSPEVMPEPLVWESPSADSRGSMPIGNGDIGANVWFEPDGDLVLLLSKTDAWSENGRLLKLGRLRISAEPAWYANGQPFVQTLDLAKGEILIRTGAGEGASELRVWIDAHQPVIQVEAAGKTARTLTVQYETWRSKPRTITHKQELHSAYGVSRHPTRPVVVEADTLVDDGRDRLAWYHRNERSIWAENLELQALVKAAKPELDPLLHRCFGALVQGSDLMRKGASQLVSKTKTRQQRVSIYPLSAITDTADAWVAQVEANISAIEVADLETSRTAHRAWWQAFWQRSWIRVSSPGTDTCLVPENEHPVYVGRDPKGQNSFRGEIGGVRIFNRALSGAELGRLGKAEARDFVLRGDKSLLYQGTPEGDRIPDSAGWTFSEGATLSVWLKAGRQASGGGRILDKCTPTTAEGIVLDTCPGNSLRLITKAGTLVKKNALPVGNWVHVAAVADPVTDKLILYLNGEQIASQSSKQSGETLTVTRGYNLQRWIHACGGRGNSPIKFNGSIFTVEGNDKGSWDADYRRWGGCYWWQNTRLPYWSMLASGDFDLMQPVFKMYLDALPLRKLATQTYYGHEGAFYPETMTEWGSYNGDNYGWQREGKPDGLTDNNYIRMYWQGGLEMATMMMDHYDYSADDAFRDRVLLPFAREIVTFFDQHWKRGEDGKIYFHPAMSLETWWDASNPLPEIAGLRYLLPRLIPLAPDAQTRAAWERTLRDLPPIPVAKDKAPRLLPAERFANKRNQENPEMYAVWPYRLYGTELPDLNLALEAWQRKVHKGSRGWYQTPIQAACLGLAEEARTLVTSNFSHYASGFRFPAMWGPNFDWIPDQDHGSVPMTALQNMLLQVRGDELLLLPAWPKDWDVDFKLHAPGPTVVRGCVCSGKLIDLNVSPTRKTKTATGF